MADRDATLIAALGRIVRSPALVGRITDGDAAGALLAELGVGEDDRRAMLAVGEGRLVAYHTMVHDRLRRVVRAFLPRTVAFRGRSAFDADVDAFIDAAGTSSPFLRDFPGAFVSWVPPRWTDAAPFLVDLARYELLAEDVANDARDSGTPTDEPVALDRGVRVNATARRVELAWAVHRVPEPASEAEPPPAPEPTSVVLIVARDRHHAVREREVDPLGAALFARLADGATLQAAVVGAASDVGAVVDDALLERATYAIAGLAEIDALLGAEPG